MEVFDVDDVIGRTYLTEPVVEEIRSWIQIVELLGHENNKEQQNLKRSDS